MASNDIEELKDTTMGFIKTKIMQFAKHFGLKRARVYQAIAMLLGAAGLVAGFNLIADTEPGWGSWLVAAPAFLVLMLTVVARLKDLTDMRARSQFRRLGLILVGAASLIYFMAPLTNSPHPFPTWKLALLAWGMALTWVTTPNMPPWWKYISRELTEKETSDAIEDNKPSHRT